MAVSSGVSYPSDLDFEALEAPVVNMAELHADSFSYAKALARLDVASHEKAAFKS